MPTMTKEDATRRLVEMYRQKQNAMGVIQRKTAIFPSERIALAEAVRMDMTALRHAYLALGGVRVDEKMPVKLPTQ